MPHTQLFEAWHVACFKSLKRATSCAPALANNRHKRAFTRALRAGKVLWEGCTGLPCRPLKKAMRPGPKNCVSHRTRRHNIDTEKGHGEGTTEHKTATRHRGTGKASDSRPPPSRPDARPSWTPTPGSEARGTGWTDVRGPSCPHSRSRTV